MRCNRHNPTTYKKSCAHKGSSKRAYMELTVRVKSPKDVVKVEEAIKNIGFNTFSLLDASRNLRLIFTVFDLFLGLFGSLALTVASLGIINTLVMAILERRREIGVLKALGATDRDVRSLFFAEAGAMGLVGGIGGVVIGWLIGAALTWGTTIYLKTQDLPGVKISSVPWWLAAGAIAFAVIVSLVAGLYPAARAAKAQTPSKPSVMNNTAIVLSLCRGGARSARPSRLATLDRAASRQFTYGRSIAAPQARTQQMCLPQSVFSFFNPTATPHNFPPTTHSPFSTPSHNPNPPNATDAQTHLHSETGAASTSSTKKISAPSKPAANKHPNTSPIHPSIRAYKNPPARQSKRVHPPQPNSTLSLPSAARYAPHLPTKIISRDASAPPQNSASASRRVAESPHRAIQIHRASQIASAIPPRSGRPTNHQSLRRARTANRQSRKVSGDRMAR